MAVSRRVVKTSVAVVAVVAALIGVDSGFAIHAEKQLAQHIKDEANLPMTPYVKLGGMAYLSSFVTGRWSSINVRARDIETPGFGLVSVEFGAANVSATPESVWTGNFDSTLAKTYFTKLQLDGLSLGRQMNFTDLAIQNREDVSPAGGWETEAIFEATPAGWEAPAQVVVELRIKEDSVIITPVEILSGPESATATEPVAGEQLSDEVKTALDEAFSLTLPGSSLPLGLPPTRIFASGGSVTIEGEQIRCNVEPENFMPSLSTDEERKIAASARPEHLRDPNNCRVRKTGA